MRPKGVADAQTVENLLPPKILSKGTLAKLVSRAMVDPVERDRKTSREVQVERGEKSFVNN